MTCLLSATILQKKYIIHEKMSLWNYTSMRLLPAKMRNTSVVKLQRKAWIG